MHGCQQTAAAARLPTQKRKAVRLRRSGPKRQPKTERVRHKPLSSKWRWLCASLPNFSGQTWHRSEEIEKKNELKARKKRALGAIPMGGWKA